MLQIPEKETLEHIQHLYDDNKFVQAVRAGEAFGPIGRWPGLHGRLLAGRLASRLGRHRWAFALHRLAWRQFPNEPEAVYFGFQAYTATHGAIPTWLKLQTADFPVAAASADTHSSWIAFRSLLCASLRDFENAEKLLAEADRVCPLSPWIATVHSIFCHMADRRQESIDWADRALEIRPWYRPAVDQRISLFLASADRERALDLLSQGLERIESLEMLGLKIRLLIDMGKYDDAWSSLQQLGDYDALGCLQGHGEKWLNHLRCDLACRIDSLCGLPRRQVRESSTKLLFGMLATASRARGAPTIGDSRGCRGCAALRSRHDTLLGIGAVAKAQGSVGPIGTSVGSLSQRRYAPIVRCAQNEPVRSIGTRQRIVSDLTRELPGSHVASYGGIHCNGCRPVGASAHYVGTRGRSGSARHGDDGPAGANR